MSKMLSFMLLLYFGMALAVGILAGGGGYATTTLTSSIDADDTTLEVVSTDGFLSSTDYIEIKNEKILYTGTTDISFTGCTRGHKGTTPNSYTTGTAVYTISASTINNALGFSVAATVDDMGLWSIITIPLNFIIKTIPRLLVMPYQLFGGDLIIIATILVIIQAAVVITIAISLLGSRRVG